MMEETKKEGPVLTLNPFAEEAAPQAPEAALLAVEQEPADSKILADWLSEMRGARVKIFVPQKGEKHGLQLFGVLPQDEGVYRCDCDGEPSSKLPASNPVKVALKGIMQEIGL